MVCIVKHHRKSPGVVPEKVKSSASSSGSPPSGAIAQKDRQSRQRATRVHKSGRRGTVEIAATSFAPVQPDTSAVRASLGHADIDPQSERLQPRVAFFINKESPGTDALKQPHQPIVCILVHCRALWKTPDRRLDRMEGHRLAAHESN